MVLFLIPEKAKMDNLQIYERDIIISPNISAVLVEGQQCFELANLLSQTSILLSQSHILLLHLIALLSQTVTLNSLPLSTPLSRHPISLLLLLSLALLLNFLCSSPFLLLTHSYCLLLLIMCG